jgi:dihydrofolate reductase
MNLIVAVDANWAIGKDGDLLACIPADMKQFKEKTIGNFVVMGRKTLESFPKRKPLCDRTNVVLTHNKSYQAEGVWIFHSIEELIERLEGEKNVFVIGGGEIYKQLLPYCTTAYVTYINHSFEADTFFVNLEENKEWILEEESECKEDAGYQFTFRIYRRVKGK